MPSRMILGVVWGLRPSVISLSATYNGARAGGFTAHRRDRARLRRSRRGRLGHLGGYLEFEMLGMRENIGELCRAVSACIAEEPDDELDS